MLKQHTTEHGRKFPAMAACSLALALYLSLSIAGLPVQAFAADTKTNPQKIQQKDCHSAVLERLNVAIGFYRVEIAASHFISQYEAAANDAARRKNLEQALSSLQDLRTNLQTKLAQLSITPDANGLCASNAAVIVNLHDALGTYSQVVQDRWQFMQGRLNILKSGQRPTADMTEAELWVREPRARYDVWRYLAQTGQINAEASAALYVLGMLSRVEWHTSMALYSSLQTDNTPQGLLPPPQHIQNAASDANSLKSNWPTPSGATNNTLWANLNNIAKSLPDTRPQDIPKTTPANGWAGWVSNWIGKYAEVFTRSIPKALSALEDVASK